MSDYKAIYSQDNPQGKAHGWIQWKGTNVCIDLHCECGYHGHIDDDFFYYYKCPKCQKTFAVGQNVKLIPLTKEQTENAEKTSAFCIKTCELNPEDED